MSSINIMEYEKHTILKPFEIILNDPILINIYEKTLNKIQGYKKIGLSKTNIKKFIKTGLNSLCKDDEYTKSQKKSIKNLMHDIECKLLNPSVYGELF